MPLLKDAEIAVVDTETTGFDPATSVLLEVAVIRLVDGAVAGEWSTLIRPPGPIPPDATRVHGITDAMVADAPAPGEAAARLRAEIGDRFLVFHNAPFDLPFLMALLRQERQPPLMNPIIDTLGLARAFPGAGSNSLEPLARRLGMPEMPRTGGLAAHRALGDARTTVFVLRALAERWERERGTTSLLQLAAESQDIVRQSARPGYGGR